MNNVTSVLPEKHTQRIIWAILCLTPILGMTIDLIAPALPAIATSLHVSTGTAKNVITLYLLGFALGNFITGFLTDTLGRQKLLRIVLVGFILSSLLPVIMPRIEILLIARFLQGFTIGGASVISRAIFSDVSPPEKVIHLGILNSSMYGIGAVIGPLIGGYLQFYFGWQACFTFFIIMIFIIAIPIFMFVPETCFKQHPLNMKTIKHNIIEVLANQRFVALAIMMGLTYSMAIAFNTVGPFLIQTKFKYSSIFFGRIALVLGLVFLSATFISRHLLKRYNVGQLLSVFISGFFVIALLMVIAGGLFNNSILLITIASIFMFFAYGSIFPMTMGKGISLFRHIAGTAVATMYLINILITSLTAFVLSLVSIESSLALLLIYFLLMAVCTLVYRSLLHNRL